MIPDKVIDSTKTSRPWRDERVLALLVMVWIVILHMINFGHAGGLWRDEADTADFAAMPVGPLLHNLHNDVFPLLFVVVARVWFLTGATGDFGCRLLGFLIGVATLGVVWFTVRRLSGRPPFLALALCAVNPLVIRASDSLRPYGLAIAMVLLTVVLMWMFLEKPGGRRFFGAGLAAVLSVQCLYQNVVFIAAICGAAGIVAMGRKETKTFWCVCGIGLLAAFSLVPYWDSVVHGQMALGIRRSEIRFDGILSGLWQTVQAGTAWMIFIWLALGTAGCVLGIRQWRTQWNLVYCLVILIAGSILYLGFMRIMGLPPRYWYYPIMMVMAAVMLDSILATTRTQALLTARIALSFLIVLASAWTSFAGVQIRQTNVDLVAAKLKENAQPKDLIIVTEWFDGVSFQRYLDTNLWTTLPPLEDVRVHRDDLIKKAMAAANPIGPLLDSVRQTLASGHRVWIAGPLPWPATNRPPDRLPPFAGNLINAEGEYNWNWESQLGYLMERHVKSWQPVDVPVPDGAQVNNYENVSLSVFSGWHE